MRFSNLLLEIEALLKSSESEKLKAICALLKQEVYHYDWVGIYKLDGTTLVLTDYAGKYTEHDKIPVGKGVCGQVAESNQSMIVQDVSQESNYIACSIDVQSEIVVPIQKDGEFIAEIDIDSHAMAPFTDEDLHFLEKMAHLIAPLI